MLGEREKISVEICGIIDKLTDPWGIKVENVELKDISLPEEMQRVIAKAAETMAKVPGALHLRTLSTINDLSSDQSNTIIFAIPIEVLKAVEGLGEIGKAMSKKVETGNKEDK